MWAFIPLAMFFKDMPTLNRLPGQTMVALAAAVLIAQPVFMWEASSPLVQDIFGRVVVSLPFVGAVLLLGLMVREVFHIGATENQTDAARAPAETVFSTAFQPPLKWPASTKPV